MWNRVEDWMLHLARSGNGKTERKDGKGMTNGGRRQMEMERKIRGQ
jgi:hypothetical protein